MLKLILSAFFVVLLFSCSTNNNGTVTVVPIAPTALTGTVASTTQINLSWTDNATNEEGYKIERKSGSGSFSVIGSTGTNLTTFNDMGLAPNTTYTYRVYAFNGAGNSLQYSNEITLTTALLPSLTTSPISDTTAVSATCGGNITSDAGSAVTARGICWSTSSGPTTALTTKTIDGTGTGSFTSNITGLSANTTYYVRAYATNTNGTNYGNEVSFTTTAVDITTGLIAFYPFNGNANDESGNGNNGTVNGATLTTDRNGIAGKSYSFDGYSNISIPHNSSLNLVTNITISSWFLSEGPPNFRTSHTIISKRAGNVSTFPYSLCINYQFGIPSDYKKPMLVTASSIGYQYLQSTRDISNGVWSNLISVINGTNLKLYLDGTIILDTVLDNSLRTSNLADVLIGSGGRPDLPAEQFIGKLDDIRIYNRALSASEVAYLATH